MDRVGVASEGCFHIACASELNETDRFFFAGASGGSWEVLAYAKILSKKLEY